jgi:hypothetical protein
MSHNDHIHDHIRADSPKSSPEPGPQHTHEKKSQLKYESQDTREARNEDEAENEAEDDLKVDAEADGSGDAVPKTDGALRFQTLAARPRLRGVSGKLAAALGTSNSPAKNRQLRTATRHLHNTSLPLHFPINPIEGIMAGVVLMKFFFVQG